MAKMVPPPITQTKAQQEQVQALRKGYLKNIVNPSMRTFQAALSVDKPAKGPIWISRSSMPASDGEKVRDLLYDSIDSLAQSDNAYEPNVPLADVGFEWLGYRPVTDPRAPEPQISEFEKYKRLQNDSQSPLTILYLHGGAFYIGSPANSRPVTTQLAALTKGRIAAVAYRLAPQSPFPSALLDVFTAYLSLLSPAPDAWHSPIHAKHIVIAGDSAGGNLASAMIQVLLDLRRRGKSEVLFNGRHVSLDMPAGLTLLSPYIDYPLSMPSWLARMDIDFLGEIQHCHYRNGFGVDDLWPTNPPRGDVYCDTSCFTHPLVNPALAPSWTGAPPIWLVCGQEQLGDGIKFLAQRAAACEVPVVFTEYEGLPHIFAIMLSRLPQATKCCQDWANFCLQLVHGPEPESRAQQVHMPGDRSSPLSLAQLSSLTPDEALRLSKKSAQARLPWTGPEAKSQL